MTPSTSGFPRALTDWVERHQRVLLAALLTLALGLRLWVSLVLLPNLGFGDQPEYTGGAERLLDGLPLAVKNAMFFVRAPGYSVFIATVWKLTGTRSLVAVRVAQTLLATGTCWYVARATRLIGGRAFAVLLATLAAAVYPYLLHQTASMGTEALFTFLVTAGVYHLARGLSSEPVDLRHVAGAALLLAAGNLVRPNLSTLLPLLAMWIVFRWRRSPRTVVGIGLALALPLLALTVPWSVAVHRQGYGWIWVTDGGGIWFYMGNNPAAPKLYSCEPATKAELAALYDAGSWDVSHGPWHDASLLPAPEQQQAFWRAGLEWDRQNARVLPCLMTQKAWAYWRPWVNGALFSRAELAASLTSLPVLVCGALGLWWSRRRSRYAAVVALQALAGTAVAMIFSTEIRYRIPIVDVAFLPGLGLVAERLWNALSRSDG